jgi:hypothetical protein
LLLQGVGTDSIAEVRKAMCINSTDISFAGQLWQVFRAVITGALDSLKAVMDDAVTMAIDSIDTHKC